MRSLIINICLSLSAFLAFGQTDYNSTGINFENGVTYYHIVSDSLFQSTQDVHILEIKNLNQFVFDLVYSDSLLIKTSDFAVQGGANAAINGGFFDVSKGGSVTYLEAGNKIINWSRKEGTPGAISSQTMNGIVYGDWDGKLYLERAKDEEFYASSPNESFALITGPMLIEENKPASLPDTRFVNDRHPRSCICLKSESVILIVIDGRSKTAAGMSLPEVQELMTRLNCISGINLDGGGSSTLWIMRNDAGELLNKPSDKTGERKVANALLLKKN